MASYDAKVIERVAKYLRANLPTKQRNLGKEPKDYFSGRKMLDFLMESDFAVEINEEEGFLNNRMEAQKLARQMLHNQLYIRCEFAEKQIKKKDKVTIKTKKVLRVMPQQNQLNYEDDDVPYVWIYNPINRSTIFYGSLVLLAIVACAALPLWPIWLRNSVAGFLLFIIAGRPLIWLAIYLITFSRWNFYIMPNLDEERPLGFQKRIFPLYLLERSLTEEEAKGDDDDEGEGEGEGEGDENAEEGQEDDPDGGDD